MRSVTTELTLDEVRRLVGFLPVHTLAELAKGPLPDLGPHDAGYTEARDCRVCNTLREYPQSGPAKTLMIWHDFVTEGFDLIVEMIGEGHDHPVVRQVQGFIGALSYSRCCTIYAAAQALIAERSADSLRRTL